MSQNPSFFSFGKTPKNKFFGFSVVFFCWETVQILILKVENLENSWAGFNDFGLNLEDFGRAFK